MKNYHKDKPFKCSYCEKDFTKPRQLKSHLKDTHPEKRTSISAGDTREIV